MIAVLMTFQANAHDPVTGQLNTLERGEIQYQREQQLELQQQQLEEERKQTWIMQQEQLDQHKREQEESYSNQYLYYQGR